MVAAGTGIQEAATGLSQPHFIFLPSVKQLMCSYFMTYYLPIIEKHWLLVLNEWFSDAIII